MHKQAWCMPKLNEACLTLPYVLQQGIKLKYKNGVHCIQLIPESWSLASLSLNTTIWDPEFSCDSAFSFVDAGMDAVLIYWKKIRIHWPLAPLADLFHSWQERSVFQIRVNTVIKDTSFFFLILYLKDEDEYILLYTDCIIIKIKNILEEIYLFYLLDR